MSRTSPGTGGYSPFSQILHWLSAALVVAAWALGLLGDAFPKGAPREAGELVHVILGEGVVALLVLRLIWRVVAPPPPAPAASAELGRALDVGSKIAHVALYALLFAVPAVGVATLFAGGDALSVFGLFDIASPWPKNREAKHFYEEIHEVLAHVLIALAAFHALAALVHHYVMHDRTLKRMLPLAWGD